MEKKHGYRLIKNSLLDLFNTSFMFVTSWVISIWVARQLGPNNYGIFTLILWLTGAFSWVIGMGLIHATTKFIAEYGGKEKPEVLAAIVSFVLKIEVLFAFIVTIILLLFQTSIADYFFTPAESFFFFLAFLGLVPGVITAILSATIEGIQKFEYFTYASLCITPLSFISKVIVLWSGKGIAGLLIVMLIFSFINSIFYFLVLKHEHIKIWNLKQPLSQDLRTRFKKYNFSVFAIMLCDKIIWDKSENFFLGRFCQATEIGFYNLGFNISQKFTSILPSTFWRVLFPAMSNYHGAGDHEKTRRLFFLATRYLAFASFPLGLAGAILSYQIIHYLYGHEFIGAQRVLQIMFLSSIFTSLGEPGAAILYGYEKQSFIYKLGACMAVVNIILDIFLIKQFGAVGAAVCYAITTVIGSICGTIYTCRVMKLKYPIYSMAKIFVASVIMGIAMEIIIIQNNEVFGFVAAIIIGSITYLASSLVLGTFEQEDFALLENIHAVLPQKLKGVIPPLINFFSDLKRREKK